MPATKYIIPYTVPMLSFSHTLISLPFAYYLDSPLLIFLAAFVFHFFADTLLHWNFFPEQSKRFFFPLVALEILAGLIAAWLLVGTDILTLPVLAAIAGGNAPDVIHQSWELLTRAQRKKYFSWALPGFIFHDKLQNETLNIRKGALSQVALILLAILLLKI